MELELKIHHEPWIGDYLRVTARMPNGEEVAADLDLTTLKNALDSIHQDED